MGQLGDMLRDTRQCQQLSLDDVEAATKIRKKYIIALEQEDFSRLPALIYAKGFLRSYASFLGLDADTLAEMVPEPPPQQMGPATHIQKPPKSIGSWLVVVVVFLMVGMVGFYLYEQGSTAPIERSEVVVELATATSVATSTPIPTLIPQGLTNTVEVQVKAVERTWVAVAVDSQAIFTDTLVIGDNFKWTGREKVVMWIGNGGGLDVSVNSQRKGYLGKPGEVLNVEFTAAGHKILSTGLQTPAAATPTSRPSSPSSSR